MWSLERWRWIRSSGAKLGAQLDFSVSALLFAELSLKAKGFGAGYRDENSKHGAPINWHRHSARGRTFELVRLLGHRRTRASGYQTFETSEV